MLLLGLSLLVFSFFGYTNAQKTFFLPAFISELWGALFFLLAQLSNSFSLFIIKAGFLILGVKVSMWQFLGFDTNFIFNSFKVNSKTNNLTFQNPTKHINTGEFNFTPNNLYDNNLLELARSLSQATYALRKLQDSSSVQFLIESLQRPTKMHIDLLLYDVLDLNYSENAS
jgi:hypothetical protein